MVFMSKACSQKLFNRSLQDLRTTIRITPNEDQAICVDFPGKLFWEDFNCTKFDLCTSITFPFEQPETQASLAHYLEFGNWLSLIESKIGIFAS